ncbi:MAG: hypothetical protein AAF798_09400 [Bacteroidota bacterium]
MKSKKKYFGKRDPKVTRNKSKSSLNSLIDKTKDETIDQVAKLLVRIVLAFIILVCTILFLWTKNPLRDKFFDVRTWTKNQEEKRSTTIDGFVMNCDSTTLPGIYVVVKGHDVSSTVTNEEGRFSVYVDLPQNLNTVPIRFLNKKNDVIYETLYTVDKNNIDNDRLQMFALPDELLE